jgi:hypothetical protein
MPLKGKIVTIMGSRCGIGFATSLTLIKKGAFVEGWSRSKAPIRKKIIRAL